MPSFLREFHPAKTQCLLCRMPAEGGSVVLDPHQTLYRAVSCSKDCLPHSLYEDTVVWYHKACYDVLVLTYESSEIPTSCDLEHFHKATKPLYETYDKERDDTASSAEGLFSIHTESILRNSFRQELLKRLPAEIQAAILDFIGPCWYLILLGESRRLLGEIRKGKKVYNPQLDLSGDIYISKIRYRGNFYVSEVSNTPLTLRSQPFSRTERLIVPQNASKAVISSDHIGIRQIQLLNRDLIPSSDGSAWYECIDLLKQDRNIEICHKALFIRPREAFQDKSQTVARLWSSPSIPEFQPWNIYCTRNSSRLNYIRFDTTVRGILACCLGSTSVGIHAYRGPSKSFEQFLKCMKRHGRYSTPYWMFFPLKSGESILNAWVRKLRDCDTVASHPALAIRTTASRDITFGPYIPKRIQTEMIFQPLVKPSDGLISGVFHDYLESDNEHIADFGVTCEHIQTVERETAAPSMGSYDLPSTSAGRRISPLSFYMTKAPLDNIEEIQICRNREESQGRCIGILIYYSYGEVEAIGQIRWDQEISEKIHVPIQVQTVTEEKRWIVRDIQALSHSHDERDGWQKIPSSGTIAWWSSPIGDEIIFYDK